MDKKNLKEKQKKINNSKSQTLPIVIIWLIMFPVCFIAEFFFNRGFDLTTILYGSAACCFFYMLGGYASDFLKNRTLPSGIGSICDMNRYKAFVYAWIAYAVSLLILELFYGKHFDGDVVGDCVLIAALLSGEYVAGNKANKVAVTSKPKEENVEAEEDFIEEQENCGYGKKYNSVLEKINNEYSD